MNISEKHSKIFINTNLLKHYTPKKHYCNIKMRPVTSTNIKKWVHTNTKLKQLSFISNLFNNIFCTYNDIITKNNKIKNLVIHTNFLKHLNKKEFISNEIARECSLYDEYSQKNLKMVPNKLRLCHIKSNLDSFISFLSEESPFYKLIHELSNYRKHISYSIPLFIINGKEVYINTLDISKQHYTPKTLKRMIRNNDILLNNKLSLLYFLKLIRSYASKQIFYLAKNSFISTKYIRNIYNGIIYPINNKKEYIPAIISNRNNIKYPCNKSDFISLVYNLNKLGFMHI